MSSSKTLQLTPLEGLSFAPAKHPWDAQAAAERLEEALGWKALALYSLWVHTSQDSESFEAYPMLVVDMVAGEPRVVPLALSAAREALAEMEKAARDAVEDRLRILDERLARVSRIKEESRSEAEGPLSEGEEDKESETEVQSETQDERGPRANAERSVGVKDERGPRANAERSVGVKEAELIVERLAAKGSLLPAWGHDALVGFLAGLSKEKTLSADDFERISPLEFFVGLLESLPSLIPTQEFATPQARQDRSFESLGHRIAQTLKPKVNL